MQTWYKSSPFYDVGIYVGGANYCGQHNGNGKCTAHTDPGLTTNWLAQTQGQGWDFLPLWVGHQAPCVNQSGLATFTDSNAGTVGADEANSASAAMAALGLSGTLIFYDMENYTSTPGDSCSTAIRKFLSAWVKGMNANGFDTVAVYGSPANAKNDFSQVAGITQVWIAAYGSNNINAPQVTVWGVTPLCDPFSVPSCSLWSDHQRVRQYLGDKKVSFGDNNQFAIDFDIADALVVGTPSETGSNNPTYTINVIGSGESMTVTGINDDGTAVGYADVPEGTSGCPMGATSWCGFTYSGGTFTWAQNQIQGQYTYTYFTGINDLGDVVGYSGIYGFYFDGSTFTAVNYPGGYATSPEGINDDGVIVGVWQDTSNGEHAFIDDGAGFSSYDYPGAEDTYFSSINGDGLIVASYYDGADFYSFVYNPVTSVYVPAVTYPGAVSTQLTSNLSNNGQVAGFALFSNNSFVNFLYDANDGVFTNLPSSIPGNAVGVNDHGQLVGGQGSGAYLATPQ